MRERKRENVSNFAQAKENRAQETKMRSRQKTRGMNMYKSGTRRRAKLGSSGEGGAMLEEKADFPKLDLTEGTFAKPR